MPDSGQQAPARAAYRRGELAMAVGTLTSQACVYLLNIVATRSLGTSGYGEFASLLTIAVIMSIPGLALQQWTARVTAQGGDARAIASTTLGVAVGAGALTVGVVLLIAPWLDTDPMAAALATALLVAPLSWLSAAEGFLQGLGRLHAFAALILLSGAARLLFATAAMIWADGAPLVVAGVGLGTLVAAAAAWRVALPHVPAERGRPDWGPVTRIAIATGAIWVLANIDVVVARVALPGGDSGLYAAGAMIARAVQFAPQFVALSAFAALTDAARTRQVLAVASAKVAAVGLAACLGLVVLGPWVVPLVFGEDFSDVGHLAWLFALIGTCLALNQLLVAQRVARHDEVVSVIVWLGTGLFGAAVVVWWHGSVLEVALAALGANLAVASVLAGRALARP